MNPDEYEDIAYELNRELGQAEQREIARRVERAPDYPPQWWPEARRRPGATSRAYQTPTGAPAGSLGSRIRFIALTMPPDRHVWLSELAADVDRMEVERDKARTQADRAHKAVHDTLRWVEGKERDARRASDKANEQVYQQVARMLRRAFDRAGTAETGETTT